MNHQPFDLRPVPVWEGGDVPSRVYDSITRGLNESDDYYQRLELLEKAANGHRLTKYLDVMNDTDQLDQLEDDIVENLDLTKLADRRCIERALSEKLIECADVHHTNFYKLADSMTFCRNHGHVGRTSKGFQVAWNHKCNNVRLCPDESREEAKRVERRYSHHIQHWKSMSPRRSIQYAVFTLHNFRAGQLTAGKKYIYEKLKALSNEFPSIKGTLEVQEDPLSAGGEWNVHVNVILCVSGHLDWSAVRTWWGSNIYFKLIHAEKLGDTLRDMIKYCAKPISVETPEKEIIGAPGILDWTKDQFVEWMDAQVKFRRTRARGCLYAVHRRRWDGEHTGNALRRQLFPIARMRDDSFPVDVMYTQWNDLTEHQKKILRLCMDEGEPDTEQVQWIGGLKFEHDGSYRVSLIPGDNFFNNSQKTNNFSPGYGPPFH